MVVDTDQTRRRFITNVIGLAKTRVVLARAAIESGIKVTPAGIYLMGPPGIGKSVLTSSIALEAFPDWPNPNNISAPISPFDRFQSCYHGQPAVVIDELPTGTPDFIDTLASWMSMNKATVNMAAVEQKGTQFVSKLVIATGNDPIESVKSSLSAEAWRRRWTAIRVTLRPEFTGPSGKLDVEKLNALPPEQRRLSPHLSFERIGGVPTLGLLSPSTTPCS
jgi:MoxR-like ATPase